MVMRGEIYLVDLAGADGVEQGGIRPAIIVQNNTGNQYSQSTQICPITSQLKKRMPTHVVLHPQDCGIKKDSIVLCEQSRTVDKKRLLKRLGEVQNQQIIDEINKKIMISFGL